MVNRGSVSLHNETNERNDQSEPKIVSDNFKSIMLYSGLFTTACAIKTSILAIGISHHIFYARMFSNIFFLNLTKITFDFIAAILVPILLNFSWIFGVLKVSQ